MAKKYDYKEQLKVNQPIMKLVDRECPNCKSELIALPPDRAWCKSDKCNYGEMYLIGKGVYEQDLIPL